MSPPGGSGVPGMTPDQGGSDGSRRPGGPRETSGRCPPRGVGVDRSRRSGTPTGLWGACFGAPRVGAPIVTTNPRDVGCLVALRVASASADLARPSVPRQRHDRRPQPEEKLAGGPHPGVNVCHRSCCGLPPAPPDLCGDTPTAAFRRGGRCSGRAQGDPDDVWCCRTRPSPTSDALVPRRPDLRAVGELPSGGCRATGSIRTGTTARTAPGAGGNYWLPMSTV